MSTNKAYPLLIEKLDAFIRKFYINKLYRGSIYFISLLLFCFVLLNTLEYFFYLKPLWKSTLLFISITLLIILFIYSVLIPISKFYKLGKRISHKQAADIIGKHFNEVSDKLINVLELHELGLNNSEHLALIEASIDQKIIEIKSVPFVRAIDLSKNKKYLKYIYFPIAIIALLAIVLPGFIESGSARLIQYNKQFEKPAPFNFILKNKSLKVNQGDELTLELNIDGNEIPQDVYLHLSESTYKLEKKDQSNFYFKLENLQVNSEFYFEAAGYSSKIFNLEVISKPSISNFNVLLRYPEYLKRSNESLKNIGDLSIPEGTIVEWNIGTEHLTNINISFEGKVETLASVENKIKFNKKVTNSSNYTISPIHPLGLSVDTMKYYIEVIKDKHPNIELNQTRDSINTKRFYFSGVINDDYGFSKLIFIAKNSNGELQISNVPIQKNINSQRFFHYWEADTRSSEGEISYYFEVYDNDGVNGAKKTRSQIMTFNSPSEKEIATEINKTSESIKDKLKDAIKKSEQIQKDAKKLNEKLINQKSIKYEEKNQIKELIQRQQNIENEIKDIQEQLKKSNQLEEDYKNLNPELLKKKKQVEELFENMLDEKTKNMIKELEKLLEQNNKELSQQHLQKMQMENKQLEKEMDRMLEMYKQMEFNQKLSENIEKLDELSKKQEQLSNEAKDSKISNEELKKKQEGINKEFEDVKKELNKLEEKNKELEDPQDFDKPESELNEIDNKLNEAESELNKNNNKKASQSQKDAAQKMKELSNKMKSKQMQSEVDELDLNIKALRQILDNLLTASFEQEKTMEALKRTQTTDPQYVKLTLKQKNIKDDIQIIQDSLYALSKKVAQIKPFVNREITSINEQMAKSIEALADRKTPEATMRQQYSMTSINNLALLLSEILQQMQEDMNDQKQNAKPGQKPGKKKGKGQGQSLSKMQEQLNKQIEELKSGQKPGQKPGAQGQQKMSESLAKMAAQQQAIRNALNQLEKEMNKDGQGGNSKELNQLKKEMEKTETELYNKVISQETLNRQKEIMTRLLEAEKAARERELDDKRESKSGNENFERPNLKFEEYKKEKMKELELIKTVPAGLDPYYKEKVNQYFNQKP